MQFEVDMFVWWRFAVRSPDPSMTRMLHPLECVNMMSLNKSLTAFLFFSYSSFVLMFFSLQFISIGLGENGNQNVINWAAAALLWVPWWSPTSRQGMRCAGERSSPPGISFSCRKKLSTRAAQPPVFGETFFAPYSVFCLFLNKHFWTNHSVPKRNPPHKWMGSVSSENRWYSGL